MGFANSFRAFPVWARALIIATTVLGVGAVAYDQFVLGGTGNHVVAHFGWTTTTVVDVCPSASVPDAYGEDPLVALERAAADYVVHTDCADYVPRVVRARCDGPPISGHVQVRACGDLTAATPYDDGSILYAAGCPSGYADTVEHHPHLPGAGVAYWRIYNDEAYTPHHVLGHIMGIGTTGWDGEDRHATAASSWMAARPGSSPTGIRCTPD